MTNVEIISILNAHSIPYYIDGNRIYADSMESYTKLFEHVEDVTGWTKIRLYNWLGY